MKGWAELPFWYDRSEQINASLIVGFIALWEYFYTAVKMSLELFQESMLSIIATHTYLDANASISPFFVASKRDVAVVAISPIEDKYTNYVFIQGREEFELFADNCSYGRAGPRNKCIVSFPCKCFD
ncbi:hypothetical protein WL83_06395 [Burkholderia ubonensis]|nr:hypothetical protein WL83_06395 [Burkholderia ubonensis]